MQKKTSGGIAGVFEPYRGMQSANQDSLQVICSSLGNELEQGSAI